MEALKKRLGKIRFINYYLSGKFFLNDPVYIETRVLDELEMSKTPSRTVVINFLLSFLDRETTYLEIGIRDPGKNFNHINASKKYSVDPGLEFEENPADFKITSDDFFDLLDRNEILSDNLRFDVIFIDGLHLAEQVDKDIRNSFRYLKEDGFIVLHDCNPPSEWHSRENSGFDFTPALASWNGTTWKAFMKWRFNPDIESCCIDSDWGIGILSGTHPVGKSIRASNEFYEYSILEKNRKEYLNLVTFGDFKNLINKSGKSSGA